MVKYFPKILASEEKATITVTSVAKWLHTLPSHQKVDEPQEFKLRNAAKHQTL